MNLAVTNIIKNFHCFDRDFWLDYKALEKVHPDFDSIKMILLKAKRVDPKYIKDIESDFLEARELLDTEWKTSNEEAKQRGIEVHQYLHDLVSNDISTLKTNFGIQAEYQLADQLFSTEKGIFPEYRVEMKLDDNYTLVGIIDLLIKDGNHLTIIDYKTDEKISWKSMYEVGKKRSKRLKFPLNSFDDCNGVQYQLQLSLYAKILQSINPDFIIDKLEIIQIKDNKPYKTFTVDYLKDTVETLLKWYVRDLYIKAEMKKCEERIY